jgi:tetratricopeptide (TPR) repeat protein
METAKYIQISHQSCPNCGAQMSINNKFSGHVVCEYCNSDIRLIRPISLQSSILPSLTDEESKKYKNLVTIVESAMVAENYKEAYEYCNKALEVNPTSSDLWINKAICSFWESTKRDVVNKQAKETITYLRTAKSYDPSSDVLKITSENIAWNLFLLAKKWLKDVIIDRTIDDWVSVEKIYDYLKLYEVAYEIFNDTTFLKAALDEYISNPKQTHDIDWIYNKLVMQRYPNVKTTIERYIRMIQQKEPNYIPPKIDDTTPIPAWMIVPALLGTCLTITGIHVEVHEVTVFGICLILPTAIIYMNKLKKNLINNYKRQR